MPAPLDLTGRRLGRLTVLSRGPRVKWGRWQSSWVCRCDCGALVEVPQNRLPHRDTIPRSHVVDACEACRSTPCVICGTAIPPAAHSKTCSAECHAEYERRYQLEWYHSVRKHDPDDRQRRAIRREMLLAQMSDAERREMYAEQHRRKLELHGLEELRAAARDLHARRMASDPEYAATKRAQARQWALDHPDKARKMSRESARRRRATRAARQLGDIAQMIEDMDNDE